jgi:hypothetical protein
MSNHITNISNLTVVYAKGLKELFNRVGAQRL